MALLCIATITLAVGWHLRPLTPLAGGDDTSYLALSQSIRDGEYTNRFLASPTPHTKYPPGNPAWIAAVHSVAGAHLHTLQVANLLLLVSIALLIGDGVRRLCNPWMGVVTTALIAWHHELFALTGTMLSEIPFTAAIALSVWAAARAEGQENDTRWVVLASGASLLALTIRLNGIGLVVAVGAWLMLQRRWKASVLHAIVTMLFVGAWAWWVSDAKGIAASPSYARDVGVFVQRAESGLAGAFGPLVRSATVYGKELLKLFNPAGSSGLGVGRLILAAIAGIGVALGALPAWRKWPLLMLSIGFLGLTITVWPYPSTRLMVPVIPLLVALWSLGAWWLASRTEKSIWRRASVLGVGTAMAAMGIHGIANESWNARCVGADLFDRPGCSEDGSRSLVQGARLAGLVLPPDAILASGKESTVWYFSGRPVVPLETVFRNGALSLSSDAGASRWDAVLATGFEHDGKYSQFMSSLRLVCGSLRVLATADPSALVLVRRKEGEADACGAITAHLSWTRSLRPEQVLRRKRK